MEIRARRAISTKEGKPSLSCKVWFSNSGVHLIHLVGLLKCRGLDPSHRITSVYQSHVLGIAREFPFLTSA